MIDTRSSRDWENHRGSRQQPCQSHLGWRGVQLRGHLSDGTARACELAGPQREPRDETDLVLLAIFQDVFGAPIIQAVTILNAHDRYYLAGVLDLGYAHFR